jgi:hypothetical protein
MILRGLLILILILTVFFFLMPFIFGFLIILTGAAMVLMALIRFGLIPGGSFKTYTYGFGDRQGWKNKNTRHGQNIRFEDEERDWREWHDLRDSRESQDSQDSPKNRGGGWYESSQEGEIINLPETALKKEDSPETKDG